MKVISTVFVVWLGAMMLSPAHASCPEGLGGNARDSTGGLNSEPCRASERIVLAQNGDSSDAGNPKPVASIYQEQHVAQPNGLGFGPLVTGLPGINGFYDRIIDVNSQLHAQIGFNAGRSESDYTDSSIDVTRLSVLVTYRRFFSPDNGFFYGAGLGYLRNELKYSYDDIFGGESTTYKASGQGVFALAEIGWQGIKGYYFQVGFQPAVYLSYDDDYDVSEIPDVSNHRRAANDDWDRSKRPSQLQVGFGWFF